MEWQQMGAGLKWHLFFYATSPLFLGQTENYAGKVFLPANNEEWEHCWKLILHFITAELKGWQFISEAAQIHESSFSRVANWLHLMCTEGSKSMLSFPICKVESPSDLAFYTAANWVSGLLALISIYSTQFIELSGMTKTWNVLPLFLIAASIAVKRLCWCLRQASTQSLQKNEKHLKHISEQVQMSFCLTKRQRMVD